MSVLFMKTILNVNFYDVNETAGMLGLAIVTTRNYFKTGRIPARKIGKSWYADENDIKIFLSNDKSDNKQPTPTPTSQTE